MNRANPEASLKEPSTSLDALLADAERVSNGAPPRYTRDQAETAMLDLARKEARAGETTTAAFARLCGGDARMDSLYGLALAADMVQDAQAEELAKRATRNERVWELMVKGANHNRREGETVEQALDRMLRTDKTYQDAYQLYCESDPMLLSDLSPPTLRVIAAALEAKARYGMLGPGSIAKLAKHEPGANVEQALAFLGLAGRMEVGADPEPAS